MAVAQGAWDRDPSRSRAPTHSALVSTLGQPFEVLKTHLAANRHDTLRTSMKKIWARGGVAGFYQGLIPWVSDFTHGRRVYIHRRQGWFEASTKGAILLLSASEAERLSLKVLPTQTALAGSVGGLVGGLMQAYAVMGFTTTMVSLSQPAETRYSRPPSDPF